MEPYNKIDAIVFLADTPQGVNYKNIVRTDSYHVGRLKGGSAVFRDPSDISRPPWLTPDKMLMLHDLYNKSKKTKIDISEKVSEKKELLLLWKLLLPLAREVKEEDYSNSFLQHKLGDTTVPKSKPKPKKVVTKERDNIILSPDAKILKTDKIPKSEKNKKRQEHYDGSKVSVLTHKTLYMGLTQADIKYDIKCGYAKIIT